MLKQESMKRDVVIYGDPVLRTISKRVTRFGPGIRHLADELLATMRACSGLGLAAEQIGRTESICVVDTDGCDRGREEGAAPSAAPHPLVLVNPEIKEFKGTQCGQEGCLSFPELYVNIRRAQEVTVAYQDLAGEAQSLVATDLLARAIQHEIDHLNGILFIDRMSPAQKVATVGKVRRIRARGKEKVAAAAG